MQIGSKEIYNDLLKLGLRPKKSKRLTLPKIPSKYFSDFTRGYFDGDGCVVFGIYPRKMRKKKVRLLRTIFTSGNKGFLKKLLDTLRRYANLKGGSIVKKTRGGFDLSFSINDSKELYRFMYKNMSGSLLLRRKYDKFQEALKLLGT